MKKKTQKGITLLALIITTIVLLIIATVTISYLINGGDNIISKALSSKKKYEDTSKQESFDLMYNSLLMSGKKQEISYDESLETISNPDRGFYIPVKIKIEDSEDSIKKSIRNIIKGQLPKECGSSLLHLRIDIGYFSDRADNYSGSMEITTEYIEKLNACMQFIRENNFKATPIFAYTFESDRDKEPSSFEQILKHIKQLSPFFNENKDIITVVEAGFLGPWGEMHWTEYRVDENKADEKFENVSILMDALLDSVPAPLQINVRLPGMIIQKYGENSVNERVGMFNCAIFSNCIDYGTYNPYTTWLNRRTREQFIEDFMKPLTKYTIYGGEVVLPTLSKIADFHDKSNYLDNNKEFASREYDEYVSIEYVQEEVFKTHLTYLNYQWNTKITKEKWVEELYKGPNKIYNGQTAQKYIMDHLGYRFCIKKSVISEKVEQSEKFAIKLDIENTGFGNTVNPKKAKLILKKDDITYEADLNINTRNWVSNNTYTEKIIMSVPSNIEAGEWKIYLKVFDQDYDEDDKFKEDYTIKFANDDIWSTDLKANYIGKIEILEKTNVDKNIEFKQIFSY